MMHESVKNFSVRTIEVGGFCAALSALRLPFGLPNRSTTLRNDYYSKDYPNKYAAYYQTYEVVIDEKDLHLMQTLVKRGDEHSKALRGIVVWCEINAPRYWHVELDTYRIGAERLSSESTMHIQGQGLDTDSLIEMKESLPEGTMQKRIWSFSYQSLRRIYFQRRNHRLPQWNKFCEWIETLPLAKELITLEENGKDLHA